MNYCSKVMQTEFEYQIKLINYCGILESPSKKWRNFFKTLQIFNVIVNIYCLVTLIIFMAENYSNIIEISECMAPVITTIMSLMKFSLLFFYTDDIFDLIREIRMLNLNWKFAKYSYLIKEANHLDKLVLSLLSGCCLFGGVGYLVIPFVKNFYDLFFGSTLAHDMPYKTSFFYDVTKTPAYELTYLVQVYWTYITITLNVSMKFVEFIMIGEMGSWGETSQQNR